MAYSKSHHAFVTFISSHGVRGIIIGTRSGDILGFVKNFYTDCRISVDAGAYEVFDTGLGLLKICGVFDEKVKFSYDFSKIKKCWTMGKREIFVYRSAVPFRKKGYFVLESGAMSKTSIDAAISAFTETHTYAPTKYRNIVRPRAGSNRRSRY